MERTDCSLLVRIYPGDISVIQSCEIFDAALLMSALYGMKSNGFFYEPRGTPQEIRLRDPLLALFLKP